MGQGYRKDRLSSEIVKETSRILLSELRDPRLGFITVTRAKVSDDYRHARIFVSVMGAAKQKKLTLSGLKHAQGYVQRELARRIKMRVFPEIVFELDESIDKAFKMTKIIDDLAKERKKREAGTPGEPLDSARDKSLDSARDKSLDFARDKSLDSARDKEEE